MASRTYPAETRLQGAVREVRIAPVGLQGLLGVPLQAKGVVAFAHSSGSSRLSPRTALVAAARAAAPIGAVVSRGGRADMAGAALFQVSAPTLLIVGSEDRVVLDLNRAALERLPCEKRLEIIPRAGHLFEEAGALGTVNGLARAWLVRHLREESAA